jgi:uridine kinase
VRLPSTSVTTLQRSLRDEVRQHYRGGRIVLAIDGATSTADFADGLAETFAEEGAAVFRASIDGFLRPPAERADGPAGIDEATFRRVLLDPFRMGEGAGFQLAAVDAARGTALLAHWTTAPRDAVLIVDGRYLLAPALRGAWNWSLWLDAPVDPADEALSAYVRTARPKFAASAIVSHADPAAPVRVFGDFC